MEQLVAGGVGILLVAFWTVGTNLFLLWLAYRFVRASEMIARTMMMGERARTGSNAT
jgi:hypothetical protein